MGNPFFENIAGVVASVAGSTAAIDYPGLPAYLERALHAAHGRALAAEERSLERSKVLRAGIREAAGALPLNADLHTLVRVTAKRLGTMPQHPGWIAQASLSQKYGLAHPPDIATIRSELSIMQTEAGYTETGTEIHQPGWSNGLSKSA